VQVIDHPSIWEIHRIKFTITSDRITEDTTAFAEDLPKKGREVVSTMEDAGWEFASWNSRASVIGYTWQMMFRRRLGSSTVPPPVEESLGSKSGGGCMLLPFTIILTAACLKVDRCVKLWT
jgi:hypothetical protein